MNPTPSKALLLILDGWGNGLRPNDSAIAQAHTPFFDSLLEMYPNSELKTDGLAVGLPEGQMGNSEVGHLNIGAGRVVYQNLERLNIAFKNDAVYKLPVFQEFLHFASDNTKKIHLIGLVSDGGVHSHIDHLKALCVLFHRAGMGDRVFIHAFTDGRDTSPTSGLEFLKDLQSFCKPLGVQIASICGRYYAMDRDKRWERVKVAYDALVHSIGECTSDLIEEVEKCYAKSEFDEFIKPLIATDPQGNPIAAIEPEDAVLCFNFRTDRCREITQVLTQSDFPEEGMNKLPLHFVTMTRYDKTFKGVDVLFEDDELINTLGETLSKAGKSQIRMAETEKYPHVTFFFSGGREKEYPQERRIMCPSPKVATYDLKPEMSAFDLKEKLLPELLSESADFIVLNFANADMVGHTGVFEAAVAACQAVDQCLSEIIPIAIKHKYQTLIIADHGNADCMRNEDGSPHTAHTLNLVPCILVGAKEHIKLSKGKLADVAPTILELMGIAQPMEMTGNSLLESQLAKSL